MFLSSVTRLRSAWSQLLPAAFCGALAILFAMAGPALAVTSTTPAKTTPATGEATPVNLDTSQGAGGADGNGGSLVRTIVGLLIVIAVIYGVTWVLKQVKASREPDAEEGVGPGLTTHASLPLGTGRSVHLVRAGNEYLLLGVSDGGVQTLRTYTEAEARNAGLFDDAERVVVYEPLNALPSELPKGVAPQLLHRIRSLTVRR